MIPIIFLLAFGLLVITSPPALSHYLWATIDYDSRGSGITKLHFEDKPTPGLGEFLQPFADGAQTWIRTLSTNSPKQIQLAEVTNQGNRWLSAELSQEGPRSIETYAKWGVWQFPDTGNETLLHYYAKHLDVNSPDNLDALGVASEFLLDLVPSGYVKPSQFFNLDLGVERLSNFISRWTGPSVEILVRWRGQPAADAHLTVRGPTGPKIHLKTDAKGYVRVQASEPGLWTFLSYVEESDKKGVDQGKAYDVVRYTSSLTLRLPLDTSEAEHEQ